MAVYPNDKSRPRRGGPLGNTLYHAGRTFGEITGPAVRFDIRGANVWIGNCLRA